MPAKPELAELYQLMVESVRDYAIFILDPRGNIITWNPGAERFKQYTAAEIIGKHFSIFYPEEEKGKTAMELEVAARLGRFEDEGWRLRKDGSRFWANVVITALKDKEGKLMGFGKVTRDLTERRKGEETLRRAEEALRRSNKELEEYASFVSHDLQEPLRKMASFAELLQARYGDKLDPAGRGHIKIIVEAATRMRSLIVDVLDYSRLGRSVPSMNPVQLGDVVAAARRDLDVAIIETGAKVQVSPLPAVRGNRMLLERVFQNLIGNAVKFRKEDAAPVIKIAAERRGGYWVVSVADNGIGFPPSAAEGILRPFQRLHPKEKYPGSGIGLAAAKKIVELHGGTIWAQSRPGHGSTFFIQLPERPA